MIEIRSITPQDRQAYLDMSAAFYTTDAVDHTVNPIHAQRTFDTLISGSPYAACLLAQQADEIVGFALLALTWSNESGGLCVWIEELYVAPQLRGKGVGKKLMAAVQAQYPQATRFRLELTPGNDKARALYQALGYEALAYDQMILDFPKA